MEAKREKDSEGLLRKKLKTEVPCFLRQHSLAPCDSGHQMEEGFLMNEPNCKKNYTNYLQSERALSPHLMSVLLDICRIILY